MEQKPQDTTGQYPQINKNINDYIKKQIEQLKAENQEIPDKYQQELEKKWELIQQVKEEKEQRKQEKIKQKKEQQLEKQRQAQIQKEINKQKYLEQNKHLMGENRDSEIVKNQRKSKKIEQQEEKKKTNPLYNPNQNEIDREEHKEWVDEKHKYDKIRHLFLTEEKDQQIFMDNLLKDENKLKAQPDFITHQKVVEIRNKMKTLNIELGKYDFSDNGLIQITGVVQNFMSIGKSYKFVQISDFDNIATQQIILQKSFWKGSESFANMISLLMENTIVQFEGRYGLSSFGIPSIFAHDIKILGIPAGQHQRLQAISVFHFLKMFQVKIFTKQMLQNMLRCKEELIDILMEEGKELLDIYDHNKGMGGGGGMSVQFRSSKKRKQYKIVLDVVAKTLQGLPLGIIKQKSPKVPPEFQQLLASYENKYNEQKYPVTMIDHGIKQEPLEEVEENQEQQQQQQEIQEETKEQLDITQFLPDVNDKRRVKYIKDRKKPQVQWFLKQLQIMKQKSAKNKKSINFIDIGGGRGDLAISIAKEFPESFITVIDINESSLIQGREIALKNEILNINFKLCGVEELQKMSQEILNEAEQKIKEIQQINEVYKQIQLQQLQFDVVVGLHPCGGLTDALLEFCVVNKSEFLICTCCFHSNFNLVPESFNEYHKNMFENEGDRQEICRFGEQPLEIYPISERSMQVINIVRLSIVEKMLPENLMNFEIMRFPSSFSPKNFILQGVYN